MFLYSVCVFIHIIDPLNLLLHFWFCVVVYECKTRCCCVIRPLKHPKCHSRLQSFWRQTLIPNVCWHKLCQYVVSESNADTDMIKILHSLLKCFDIHPKNIASFCIQCLSWENNCSGRLMDCQESHELVSSVLFSFPLAWRRRQTPRKHLVFAMYRDKLHIAFCFKCYKSLAII